jgi:predicted O-linked N-acetylglucosamine transferase (SPINDLY family)
MDYRLTDPFFDPPGIDESIYSERSIRLPRTWWCYEPIPDSPDVGPTPAQAAGHVTFGCLNNFSKVSRLTMEMWARIMNAVPGSRLLLHAFAGSPRQLAIDVFRKHGIDAGRLEFAGRIPFRDYAQQYNRIDIALDPYPFAGGTTSCDALWMGVPLVTLAGPTAVSRAGASLLSNVELTELIARSPDEYVQLATDLARDLPKLTSLRGSLRERMRTSPLMDAPQFARDMEAAYRQMWQDYCARAI